MSRHPPCGEPNAGSPKKAVVFETNYPGQCLALFLLIFAFSTFFVVMMTTDLFREWRVNNRFIEHRCLVEGKRIEVPHFRGGYKPHISIRYTVNGQEYKKAAYDVNDNWGHTRLQAQDILAGFTIGSEYPCWYDPDEPSKAVLIRDYTWREYLVGLIPFALMIATALGMYACGLKLWNKPRTQRESSTEVPPG